MGRWKDVPLPRLVPITVLMRSAADDIELRLIPSSRPHETHELPAPLSQLCGPPFPIVSTIGDINLLTPSSGQHKQLLGYTEPLLSGICHTSP